MSRFPLPDRLLVYGCRSRYAAEIAEILDRLGYHGAWYVDNRPEGPEPPPVAPIVGLADLPAPDPHTGVVVPVFAPGVRARIIAGCLAAGYTNYPAVVDPTAVVAGSASLGEGTVVNALVALASNTVVGRHVNVNRSASIGHDGTIGDFVSFGPGCVLMGNVVVGRGSFIGGGSTVLPDVTIGDNAVVGAGSVVTAPVPDHTLVVGNPARPVRETAGYGEVSV